MRLGLEGAIDWIGFTRNVNRELAKIDVFVLPSLFGEGLADGRARSDGGRLAGHRLAR